MTKRADVEGLKKLKMGRMLLSEQEANRLGAVLERGDETKKEPVAAEAFATMRREWMEACSPTGTPNSRSFTSALTLLERRMGAMARALIAVLYRHGDSDYRERLAREALTDAPPVFRLEEVREVLWNHHERGTSMAADDVEAVLRDLAALHSTGGGR